MPKTMTIPMDVTTIAFMKRLVRTLPLRSFFPLRFFVDTFVHVFNFVFMCRVARREFSNMFCCIYLHKIMRGQATVSF